MDYKDFDFLKYILFMAEQVPQSEHSESQKFDPFEGLKECFEKSKELFGDEDLAVVDVHITEGQVPVHVNLSWTVDGTILLTTFKGGLGKVIYGENGQSWDYIDGQTARRRPNVEIDENFCKKVKDRLVEKRNRLKKEAETTVSSTLEEVTDQIEGEK